MNAKDVTLTITCSTNNALLLLTFYDLITDVQPDDSIAAVQNIAWVIDEIRRRAPAMIDYLESEQQSVPWQLRDLAAMDSRFPGPQLNGNQHRPTLEVPAR
jgi:hypothetical protein